MASAHCDPPAPGASCHAESHQDASAPSDAPYFCPMCIGVESDSPGICPHCGMDLSARLPTADAGLDELAAMTRRFIVSALLTLPIFLLAMGEMLGLPSAPIVDRYGQQLQLLAATPVVFWAAAPFFRRAFDALLSGALNMFSLISLGVAAAYAYSVAALLFAGRFPQFFDAAHGRAPVYFEAAAMIITLVLLGQVMELRARRRTGDALRGLLELAPNRAIRVDSDGVEREVDTSELTPGDHIRVRSGERIAADGEVTQGEGTADESMLTGESLPIEKTVGSPITGGAILTQGALVARITQTGQETVLARIIALVAVAQQSRAPIQRITDRAAGWFTPAVVVAALVTFTVWALWVTTPSVPRAVLAAVSVLIIACPCALGLAAPMSLTVATGLAARAGILFRNAEALETLADIDTIVVDKTGTLTEGRPSVVGIEAEGAVDPEELLSLVASLEASSTHPLASACLTHARAQGVRFDAASEVETLAGRGLRGKVAGREVCVGNRNFLREQNINVTAAGDDTHTELLAAVDGTYLGRISFEDRIKNTTRAALAMLSEAGLRIVMATGDRTAPAKRVAAELAIDEIHAELGPDEKAELVEKLRAEGRRVAVAGDGINDAPALATAEVGIAMADGTDIAMANADLTLLRGDLAKIATAMRISRAAIRNIHQNLFFAFAYNALGIPLAAGALYPWTGLMLNPMFAGAAMSLSSVSVISNALRLRRLHTD